MQEPPYQGKKEGEGHAYYQPHTGQPRPASAMIGVLRTLSFPPFAPPGGSFGAGNQAAAEARALYKTTDGKGKKLKDWSKRFTNIEKSKA